MHGSTVDGKDIGPAGPSVADSGPSAGVSNSAAQGAVGKDSAATIQRLEEILAKGASMTREEASRGVDLLMALEGEAFRETLKKAISSGSFVGLLAAMGIWQALGTVLAVGSQLSMEVVIPTTLLAPAANTIDDDFKRANEIYNPHGIEIEKGNAVVIPEATTKQLLGGDTDLDEFSSDQATAEEMKLIEQNRSRGRITGYWLPTLSAGSRGEALEKGHLKNMLDDRTSVVISTASRAQDTFAHEVGHILGLPHEETQANNLMAPGSIRSTSGRDIDQLTDAQLAIIRSSVFLELGRRGVGK